MSLSNCDNCGKEQVFHPRDFKLLCKGCKPKKIRRECLLCKRALVSIGRNRANGKGGFNDWQERKTHAKCYPLYLLWKQQGIIK